MVDRRVPATLGSGEHEETVSGHDIGNGTHAALHKLGDSSPERLLTLWRRKWQDEQVAVAGCRAVDHHRQLFRHGIARRGRTLVAQA